MRTNDAENLTPRQPTAPIVSVPIRYRRRRVPLPGLPGRAMTIRDDMVLTCRNRLRGRYRLSSASFEPSPGRMADILRHLGRPIVAAVVTDYRGLMVDDLRAPGFLPHRNPDRIGIEMPPRAPGIAGAVSEQRSYARRDPQRRWRCSAARAVRLGAGWSWHRRRSPVARGGLERCRSFK